MANLQSTNISGNISAGATNTSYVGPAQYGGIMFPRGQILFSNTNSQNQMYITSNAYTSAGGVFAYRNSSQPATMVGQDNGGVLIATAGNGTADTTISWTTGISVSNSGYVTTPTNPAFRAYHTTNSFVNLNSQDVFIFNATEYNIGSCYNTSNGRFTAPVAGIYQINFYSIIYGAYTNAAISLGLNGGSPTSGFNIHFSPSVGGAWDNIVYTTSIYLNIGDYIFIKKTGGYTQYHGVSWSSFSGYLVG